MSTQIADRDTAPGDINKYERSSRVGNNKRAVGIPKLISRINGQIHAPFASADLWSSFNRAYSKLEAGFGIALALTVVLGGCGKLKQNASSETSRVRGQARRQQAACSSAAAYDRLKNLIFDRAISAKRTDPAKLDLLGDYSFARMEDPVVKGWDQTLDITRCSGRFILQLPPGTKAAFDGESHLETDVEYSAQAAAEGSGFVYQMKGEEPIVDRLATFNIAGGAYGPPPAIDEQQVDPNAMGTTVIAQAKTSTTATDQPEQRTVQRSSPKQPVAAAEERPISRVSPRAIARAGEPEQAGFEPRQPEPDVYTVRAFYGALGAGDGGAASAQVIPEKRTSRAFSPEGISHFYGKLAEPLRVLNITSDSPGAYRVNYRYSTGRSHCDGSAIVSLTNRGGRNFIRSIRALNGC